MAVRSRIFLPLFCAVALGGAMGAASAQTPDNSNYDAHYTYQLLQAQAMKGYASAQGVGAVGIGAAAAAGNEFFAPSEYEFDCATNPDWPVDGVYSYANWSTQSIGDDKFNSYKKLYNMLGEYRSSNGQLQYTWGFMRTANICRTVRMPEVDAGAFISTLTAKGYEYLISYPEVDPGNGHALITWSKGGNSAFGSARLTGAGWRNQYEDYQDCIRLGFDKITDPCRPVTTVHRDRIGGIIGTLDAADIPNGVRLAYRGGIPTSWFMTLPTQWQNAPYNSTQAAQYAAARADWNNPQKTLPGAMMSYHVMAIVDPWISSASAPPKIEFPPIPPAAGAGDPGAVNIGAVSDGVGSGATTPGASTTTAAVPFDYEAFCNSPSSDGKPRSPLWVQNCLGAKQ